MNISKYAIIHPEARLGEGVQIEPFVTIGKEVEIGANTWIKSHAHIHSITQIGADCKIFQGAIVGEDSQDLKYKGGATRLVIGDNVTIREYCTINRSTSEDGVTTIGDGCLLMAYVHIAHDCRLEDHVIVANAVNIAGHVHIGSYATIGGMTAVQQYIVIGRHAYVSGGTLIRKDVPPYVKAAREPVTYIGVNKIGLQRRGFSETSIVELQNLYRSIFVHSKNISVAMSNLERETIASPLRNEVMAFIKKSPNGLIRGFMGSVDDPRYDDYKST